MSSAQYPEWPVAELDPLRRLKVFAAAQSRSAYAERHFDATPGHLWAVISDLEGTLPHLIPAGLGSFTVEERDGERLRARAVSRTGHQELFDVVLRPCWCLMQSETLICGMAAVAEDDGTRFAFLSSVRTPGDATAGQAEGVLRPGRTDHLLDRLQQRLNAHLGHGSRE